MQSKNKTRLTVVTLIVLTVTLFLMATDRVSRNNIFPYEMKQFQLENGLNVVAIPYDSPGILAYYTIVRTGSRNEVEPGKSGFAHFFEHVMFRGTEKYPADVYNKEMQLLGADFNASTDDDWTRYYQVLPSSGLEKIIDIESDRFQNLKYTEQAFKTEAGAILGEYNKSMSNPFLAMFERIQELAFTTHTYGHTTIGYLQDIKDMPNQYAYSLDFYDRWYRPENCTVLVVGDFDYDQLQKLIKQYYSGWKRRDYKQAIQSEPEQTSERRAAIKWKSPTFPILMTGYKTPGFSVQSKDYAAMDILGSYVFGEIEKG
ncbi:insulinase family protein [bacterium]|nr:insulinase family protein [bacterium]